MKQQKRIFIKNSLAFILILIGLILVINISYIKYVQNKKLIYRTESTYQEYIQDLNNDEISFLFLGDSHTKCDFNPAFVNNSFNFANDGENYIETFYRLQKILYKDKIKVDNIVLEIDLHSFSEWFRTKDKPFNEVPLYSEYLPLVKIARLREDSLIDIVSKRYFPFIGSGKDFIEILLNPTITPIYKGWKNNTGNFNLQDKDKTAYNQFLLHFGSSNSSLIDNTSFKYFTKILKLAQQEKIKVIFIKYPISKEYESVIQKEGICKEEYYRKIFQGVNKILKGEYILLDYSSIFFNNSRYFADSDHLNYIGAERLSKIISTDLGRRNLTKE